MRTSAHFFESSTIMSQIGKIACHKDGSFEGTLHRVFEGKTREAVWKMLVEPAGIAQWLAPGTIDAKKGGRANISFEDSGIKIDSEVVEYEANQKLAYSWSSGTEPIRLLQWALSDDASGTALTLTVGTPAGEDAAKACAGFEAHLEMLAAALEGIPVKFPFNLYKDARAAYSEQIAACKA
ncbi:Hypothetical protein HDN1F_19620 [gamma proteobacterium HdN1]|nr:Hypothetical protein HDN1F_19620 [gamma proteobacterium HdN1]